MGVFAMNELRTGICPRCGKFHGDLDDCRDYVLASDPVGRLEIEHKLPTSEQMRKVVKDKLARGESLGASHVRHVWDAKKKEWDDDHPVTDEEKHAYCIRRTGFCATFLSPALYAEAEREGTFDMRRFVMQRSMPITGTLSFKEKTDGPWRKVGDVTSIEIKPSPWSPPPFGSLDRKVGKHPALGMPYGKTKRCRGCSGFCLLGLNGKCVACSEDDMT
jgi:hypothetical protein